ncbi:4301_t:CDS:1, partial [Acaulospora morrowiae]
LKDACILLTLSSTQQDTSTEQNDNNSQQKTLTQIISILFDEESELSAVFRMLESLGVYHLSPKEAKEVVGRRIDCWK